MGNSTALFEVLNFTEDNLAKALSNEHTSIEYIIKSKYHFNFLFEHLKYKNRRDYKVKTILIEHKYISHTYLSDLGAEFIFSSQDYSKFCKRIHFFSRSFTSIEELITDPENTSTKRLWDSYKGFVTVKPLPKSRLGPIILAPYPPNDIADRRFTAIRSYNIHLLGHNIQLKSLAFMEQDGILSACSTVALWSSIHRLHHMFNIGIQKPVEINTLAKYTARNQPGALPGIGMDSQQICGVIEQIGLKTELRTLIGGLGNLVKANEKIEIKDKTYIRKFIYAYLKMGLPILLGLEFEDASKHLITLTGYRAVKLEDAEWIRLDNQPITYAEQIQILYAHDDQIGPFSRLTLSDDGSKVKTIRQKDPTAKVTRNESEVYNIIVPLSKDIRLTFEDIYQQIYYFESLFYELIDTDQNFVWDIYLTPANEYRNEVISKNSIYSQTQKSKLLTEFLPPYLWIARAEIPGYSEMEFVFDATAIPYSNDSCKTVLFFDEVLKGLIIEALSVPESYDKELYLHINNVNQFIDSKMDSAHVWLAIRNVLFNNPIDQMEDSLAVECSKKEDQVNHPSNDDLIPDNTVIETDENNNQKLEANKEKWKQMIANDNLDTPIKEVCEYCKQNEKDKYNTAIVLQSRLSRLKRNQISGTIDEKEYSTERNKIAAALLDFIDSL